MFTNYVGVKKLNQTDFLKKKFSSSNNTKKARKKISIKNKNLFVLVILLFMLLIVIFAISFLYSYNKLAKNKEVKADYDLIIKEQTQEIARLNTIIEEKDSQIDQLNKEIVEYKNKIANLKTIEDIQAEMQKLPKDKVHVVEMPVGQEEQEGEDTSKVQDDLYKEDNM